MRPEGGRGSGGIPGMFVGATLLALGCQIFMSWVATDPDSSATELETDSPRTI
jgi:hypothetical protein